MSKTSVEVAGDITIAWLDYMATKNAIPLTEEETARFYRAVYETIESCAYPRGRITGPVPKPPGC